MASVWAGWGKFSSAAWRNVKQPPWFPSLSHYGLLKELFFFPLPSPIQIESCPFQAFLLSLILSLLLLFLLLCVCVCVCKVSILNSAVWSQSFSGLLFYTFVSHFPNVHAILFPVHCSEEVLAGVSETRYLYSKLHRVASHKAITLSHHHENLIYHSTAVEFVAAIGMQH